jgi:hypothetical protein
VLTGAAFNKACDKYGLDFMHSLSCNTPAMIVASL